MEKGKLIMNCPKCKYDMYYIYEKVLNTGKNSRYCKITNTYPGVEGLGSIDWDVECKCPKCGHKWVTSDGNY